MIEYDEKYNDGFIKWAEAAALGSRTIQNLLLSKSSRDYLWEAYVLHLLSSDSGLTSKEIDVRRSLDQNDPKQSVGYEQLRAAAMRMQVSVAIILVTGGLDIEKWFDNIVAAQRDLSSKTHASRSDLELIREKYKILDARSII